MAGGKGLLQLRGHASFYFRNYKSVLFSETATYTCVASETAPLALMKQLQVYYMYLHSVGHTSLTCIFVHKHTLFCCLKHSLLHVGHLTFQAYKWPLPSFVLNRTLSGNLSTTDELIYRFVHVYICVLDIWKFKCEIINTTLYMYLDHFLFK